VKTFKIYLKAKTTWGFHLIFSLGYFFLVQAYVYPTLSFDFSVSTSLYKFIPVGHPILLGLETEPTAALISLHMELLVIRVFINPHFFLRELA
jgi:hypothetical protein